MKVIRIDGRLYKVGHKAKANPDAGTTTAVVIGIAAAAGVAGYVLYTQYGKSNPNAPPTGTGDSGSGSNSGGSTSTSSNCDCATTPWLDCCSTGDSTGTGGSSTSNTTGLTLTVANTGASGSPYPNTYSFTVNGCTANSEMQLLTNSCSNGINCGNGTCQDANGNGCLGGTDASIWDQMFSTAGGTAQFYEGYYGFPTGQYWAVYDTQADKLSGWVYVS